MTLKIAPALLEDLLECTGLLIYDADTISQKVFWSGAIELLTGYAPDDFKSWNIAQWWRQVLDQDRRKAKKAIEQARDKAVAYQLEYRFRKKNGDYVWFEDVGIFRRGDSARMIGTIRDIHQRKNYEKELLRYHTNLEEMVARRTAELLDIDSRLSVEVEERNRTEKALSTSEERYRRVFENTGTATVLVDPDMTISMANAKAAELYGYPLEELIGHFKIIDFAAPAYRDRLGLYHELYIQGDPNVPNQFEFQMIDRHGQVRDLMAQVQWIPKVGQAVASFLDMTEAKKAEHERERLAAVIEQSTDSIVITDMRGTIEYANRVFEDLHGVDPVKVVGQNIEAPFFGKQEYRILKQMTYMVSGEDNWSGRIRNRKPDGQIYIADTTILPICDRRGRAVNLVCIKKDVTREVQLEKQLQHAQKMEAIGTLAGGIAHDFNNILGGILGFTELSLHIASKDNEQLRRNLRRILEGCERAKDLIHHILTFSRKTEDKNMPIEIQLAVKEALKLLRASIPSTIAINQNLNGDQSIVCTTPTHIHQIVMNLCANAAQAMEENGGTLEVDLENIDLCQAPYSSNHNVAPGPFVLLKISDSGKGMPPAVVERIFEPYFTTKPQSGGTGLGLSVVHGIVSNLKGFIQVDSAVDKGTTFKIFLPRVEDQAATEIEPPHEPPRGQEHILVVDDEVFILEIMSELLGELGYKVDTVGSGHQAMDLLRVAPRKYDLVIADQVMPKMTGRQLAEAAMQLQPDLPFILCTGMGMQSDMDFTHGDTVRTILTKPIDYGRLAATVREVLDAKK